MERYDFSPAGVLLGLILGPICEDGFRSMIKYSEGHLLSYVFSRPISVLFFILIVLTIFFAVKNKKRFTGQNIKD